MTVCMCSVSLLFFKFGDVDCCDVSVGDVVGVMVDVDVCVSLVVGDDDSIHVVDVVVGGDVAVVVSDDVVTCGVDWRDDTGGLHVGGVVCDGVVGVDCVCVDVIVID